MSSILTSSTSAADFGVRAGVQHLTNPSRTAAAVDKQCQERADAICKATGFVTEAER